MKCFSRNRVNMPHLEGTDASLNRVRWLLYEARGCERAPHTGDGQTAVSDPVSPADGEHQRKEVRNCVSALASSGIWTEKESVAGGPPPLRPENDIKRSLGVSPSPAQSTDLCPEIATDLEMRCGAAHAKETQGGSRCRQPLHVGTSH